MLKLDHINIQTVKLAETVAFYRDVLDLKAGNPPPPLDPAEVQWMFDPEGNAIFHLSTPGSLSAIGDINEGADTGAVHHVALSCQGHDGMIDKYLGDGFLAYWREDENSARNVAAALAQLREAQAQNAPRFRLALHNGMVAIGGVPSIGEESLMGKDVNFVFRMEKLAGALGVSFQQVQNYEKGTNRVSAVRLFNICKILNVSPVTMFPPGASQGS